MKNEVTHLDSGRRGTDICSTSSLCVSSILLGRSLGVGVPRYNSEADVERPGGRSRVNDRFWNSGGWGVS